ncbi:DUF2637 domain-containing protein [Streptomyces gilvosporeus]
MPGEATQFALRAGLVGGLALVVGLAFRVSWNALHDIARGIGADHDAALLYPVVVDGLIAVALVASLALTGRDRRAALTVLASYTAASLALNYVHGLIPLTGDRPRLSPVDWVHWALVLLASSLPVGAIFFGTDLVARVLRTPWTAPATVVDTAPAPVDIPAPEPVLTVPEPPVARPVPVPVAPAAEPEPEPLAVICGGAEVFRLEVPPAATTPVEPEPVGGLSAEEAAQVIEQCWREGLLSIRKTAELADRSKSLVEKQFAALAERYGPRPAPQQMALQGVAA